MSCFWKYGGDPKQLEIKLNMYYLITFFIPETCWYIYGSVLIYDETLDPCKNEELPIVALYYSAFTIVVGTYIYFIYLLGICVLFLGAFMTFRDYKKGDDE